MPDATNTTYPSVVADRDVRLTPTAGSKMAELLRDVDKEIQGIRVFVTGGGCSGMLIHDEPSTPSNDWRGSQL